VRWSPSSDGPLRFRTGSAEPVASAVAAWH
jgi:hypothetical protein